MDLDITLIRTTRTPSSERYLIQDGGKDLGAVDLHYMSSGAVRGTVVLEKGFGTSEARIAALLKYLDEVLLPDVSLEDHTLSFSVVVGDVVGDFHAERQA